MKDFEIIEWIIDFENNSNLHFHQNESNEFFEIKNQNQTLNSNISLNNPKNLNFVGFFWYFRYKIAYLIGFEKNNPKDQYVYELNYSSISYSLNPLVLYLIFYKILKLFIF